MEHPETRFIRAYPFYILIREISEHSFTRPDFLAMAGYPDNNSLANAVMLVETHLRMKGVLTFSLFLLLFLFLSPSSRAGHSVYGAKIEYRFVHPDSLEIVLTVKTNCIGWSLEGITGAVEKQYYYAQLLHIVRQQDTLLDSLDYCNSYLNHSVCPDTMSRCLDGPMLFSTAIFEYKKVFPLSYFAECELTFFWQEETNQSVFAGPGRSNSITSGNAGILVYVYAYLNYCHIPQPNSPLITRDFPDALPHNRPIKYRYSVSVDEPEDDSVYIDLIMPKTTNGADGYYSGNHNYYRPVRFMGFPNHTLPLPAGFHLDPVCGILEFTGVTQNEVTNVNIRIQRFVRRNDSIFKVSELNYEHTFWITAGNDYKYYFPTPPIYNDALCIEKSVYIPIVCGSGQPREPGPQKICTRDSVFLETPYYPTYAYQWYKDGAAIASATQSGYWASDSGSYRVAVVNAETGCSKFSITMQVLIDDGSFPVISYDSLRPYCQSDTAFLFRDSGDYSWFQWRKDNKPFSPDSTFVFPATRDGAYALDAVNERGCRVRSNTLNLKFNLPVTAPLFDTTVHNFCGAFSDTLRTERPLFEYNWIQPGSSTDSFLIVDSTSMVHLEGKDTLGCPVKDSLLVRSFALPVSNLQNDTAFCSSDSIRYFLYAQTEAGPGVHYQWNASVADSSHRYQAMDSGMFFVHINDSNTCTATDSIVLVRTPPLPVGLGEDRFYCYGEPVSDTLETPLKDTTGLLFLWNTGAADTFPHIRVFDTGSYILRVQDSAGCQYPDTLSIIYHPLLNVDLGPDSLYCFNASIAQLLEPPAPPLPEYHYQWNGSPVDTLPDYLATDSGFYWVLLKDGFGCPHSDSLRIGRHGPILLNLGKDTLVCLNSTLLLDAGQQETYLWSDGSDQRQLLVDEDGDHWVEVRDGYSCALKDSIRVDFSKLPLVELPDSVLCEIEHLLLEVDSSHSQYLWSTGGRSYQLRLRDTGLVWVKVTNACGTSIDSAWVRGCRYEPLEIYIPNGFTPNGDIHNEVFKIYIDHYREFNLAIYNRWGERVFESDSPNHSWDGTFQGVPVQQDVYVYVLQVISLERKMYAYYGNITILR